jgi:hypothetical protein
MLFFSICGLIASISVIFIFAKIITPLQDAQLQTEFEILQAVNGQINEPLETTLKLNTPDRDIQGSISLDASNRHTVIDSLKLTGNLESVYIDKDKGLAYLANSFSGLQIADISDPEHLRIVGSVSTPGHAWDIQVLNNTLFLATAEAGLYLIDISSSKKPSIISKIKFPNRSILKIEVYNQTVYASTGQKGLLIIDITDIHNPRQINSLYEERGVWGLLRDKNTLYVSSGKHHLDVLDLSNPTQPQLISEFKDAEVAWDMGLQNNILYLPAARKGLVLVDISNPYKPKRLTTSINLVSPNHIDIQPRRAYISSRTGSLSILDTSLAKEPKLIDTYNLPFRPRNIIVSGQSTYFAGGFDGLQVIETGALVSNKQIKRLQVHGKVVQALFDKHFFYLLTDYSGLYIATRDESGNPVEVIAHQVIAHQRIGGGIVNKMVRVGDYLYFTKQKSGLQMINISDPFSPKLHNIKGFTEKATDIFAVKNMLFLASRQSGIQVVDVSLPDRPQIISEFPISGPWKLTGDNKHIYLATTDSGLHIINYSNPFKLKQLGKITLPWPLSKFSHVSDLAISGKTVYMTTGAAELITFDISVPSKPQIIEIVTIEGKPKSVFVDKDQVYVSTRQGKIWIFNSDTNAKLQRQGVFDSLGKGWDFTVEGDRIIIANGLKGLALLPTPKILKINNPKTRRNDTLTITIPPIQNPGLYNLSLFDQNKLIEFIGVVKLRREVVKGSMKSQNVYSNPAQN